MFMAAFLMDRWLARSHFTKVTLVAGYFSFMILMTGSIVERFRLVRMRCPGAPAARAIAVAPPIPPIFGPVIRTLLSVSVIRK